MGIGSTFTLHGYPDSKVRATGMAIHIVTPISENYASSCESSDDDHIFVEEKASYSKIDKHQLIATAITASFTENNCHQCLNSLIPVVMMFPPKAVIRLFDCVNDLLLTSDYFDWMSGDKFVWIAFFLLWLVIYHRYVT